MAVAKILTSLIRYLVIILPFESLKGKDPQVKEDIELEVHKTELKNQNESAQGNN